MRLSHLVRSPSSASFFTPSYLSRPPLTLARPSTRAISSGSSSSNSHGSNRVKPSPQPGGSSAVRRPSHLSASARERAGAAGGPATVEVVKPVTLLAPTLPHANKSLIMSDSFFALHRPLLELPIRLSARKTVAPQPRLWERQDELDEASEELRAAEAEREEIEACARAVDRATGSPRATPTALATAEAETVQLVDLAEDGVTIVGEFYLATIDPSSATTLAEVREEVEETTEDELEFADLDRQATEAAHDDIANGLPDPYEPWLIGTHELDTPTNAAVSRYLAQHPPFVAPAPPSPSLLLALAPTRPAKSSTSWPSHVQSDISFLRPFPAPSASATANAAATVPTNPAFASHFLDPLPSGLASQVADQFLSSAILAHRFNAHLDYATHSGEALELARRAYADPANGPLPPRRRAFDEKRQRGEVRLWNEEDGWVTVDLGKGRGAGSPFLPAEMVDLDWEDDKMERLASLDGIRMDSVKRKRKKKITKHKFKKRRKEQKALRQRLGK